MKLVLASWPMLSWCSATAGAFEPPTIVIYSVEMKLVASC